MLFEQSAEGLGHLILTIRAVEGAITDMTPWYAVDFPTGKHPKTTEPHADLEMSPIAA
jgi:hypothetical protein